MKADWCNTCYECAQSAFFVVGQIQSGNPDTVAPQNAEAIRRITYLGVQFRD
jgi:hypothetical protein